MVVPGTRDIGRAERFEDEKRRIIESCFSKTDEDGSIIETYITHIRILEFSSHPASPPPPQSRSPQSEKHRVIIVAVRKSGRVRVHKSKENSNGTFSIGKTWDLNDLTAIESYTAASTNYELRQWAGNVGFLITLGKPYYWQAQTDKEKKFFISSLLKIYGKYSGGKVPTLSGFDPAELEQIQGGAQARRAAPAISTQQAQQTAPSTSQPTTPQTAPPPLASRQPVAGNMAAPSPPPLQPPPRQNTGNSNYGLSPPSRDGPRPPSAHNHGKTPSPFAPPQQPPQSAQQDYRALPPSRAAKLNGASSPSTSIDSGRSANQTTLRRLAGSNKSQESVAASMTQRSDDTASLPPRSRNGPVNGANAFGTVDSNNSPTKAAAAAAAAAADEKPPPERKRPPMDPSRPQGSVDESLVPAPLMSSTTRSRDPVIPPPRSTNRAPVPSDMIPASLRVPQGPSSQSTSPTTPTQTTPTQFTPTQSIPPPPPVPASAAPAAPRPQTPVTQSAAFSLATPTTITTESQTSPLEDESVKSPAAASEAPSEPEERPGLGPMIKKKSKGDVAGVFWRAATKATVANAFKPRPGGAGERLRQAQNKSSDEPDGITSVVPAPKRSESDEKLKEEAQQTLQQPAQSQERPKTPQGPAIPEVKVTVPVSTGRPPSAQPGAREAGKTEVEAKDEKPAMIGNDAKYLATLGVDPAILDQRSNDFTRWLDFFGWLPGERMRKINVEELKIDIDRELNRAQAGGYLSRFQEEDDRVEAIKTGIDASVAECEELDNLLTLYSVELSTLSDDIAYIEAQGQGLQVQAANQKLLKKELESLLDTCAITSADLEALRSSPLDTGAGIEEVETALVTLFKAMSKIDPGMGSSSGSKKEDGSEPGAVLNSDFGQMRVVREKREMYRAESNAFMRRLVVFMAGAVDEANGQVRRAMDGALAKKADAKHHEAGREVLWQYGPLMLYAREADLANWDRILQIYQEKIQPLYRNEFRDVMTAWKKNARKPAASEEAEILFTALQEKREEGIATTARKLTVKRSQTLARTLRSPLGEGRGGESRHESRHEHQNSRSDGRSHPYEVFTTVLDELLPLVQMEQNFVVDFFHASTLQQTDFAEAVAAARPRDRRGTSDLRRNRPMEPDRELARRVTRAMETIFTSLEQDLQGLVDWVLSLEALQGAGVLATLERKLAELGHSSQDFLVCVLQRLHAALQTRFRRFVDEQVRAIEETKVKIKKRKGVIGFMRIFPHFSAAVENMLDGADPNLAVCRTVDLEYDRILKSMFDSLRVIARENGVAGSGAGGGAGSSLGVPGAAVGSGVSASLAVSMGSSTATSAAAAAAAASADPEDKEVLNFHILLIENMNHYLEDVENPRGTRVLDEWKEAAAAEMQEHLGLYLQAVMRRPLGRLLEHLENVEAQLAAGKPAAAVAAQPSNSKAMFNKVLGSYDAREVRKGIETLRKRVEKHFGGGGGDSSSNNNSLGVGNSGPGLGSEDAASKALVGRVLRECEAFYGEVELRIGAITTNVYGGDVLYEWPRAEVKIAFSGR